MDSGISIKVYSKLLELLNNLGIAKLSREVYRHSIFSELYYRVAVLLFRNELLVKPILDNKMLLNIHNKGLEKDLFLHGIREKESTEIFRDYLEEGMKIADIGANVGYYTLLEANEVGNSGQITAIEPTLSTFLTLKKNCVINQFENIDIVNKAVGFEQDLVGINKGSSPNLNRIANSSSSEETIEQSSLVNIIDFDPDAVRMDVEGYELEILRGMSDILESDNLILFIEVHPSKIEDYYDGTIDEFWDILSNHNFEAKYLIRHPPKPKFSYFFRPEYPPKKVLEPDLSIEETRKEYPEFFEWNSTFRIFLEKNN